MFCISLFLCQHCTYCFRYERFESAHAYRSYAISKLRSAISKLGGNFKIGGQLYAISKFSNCATQFRNCANLQFARNIYTCGEHVNNYVSLVCLVSNCSHVDREGKRMV